MVGRPMKPVNASEAFKILMAMPVDNPERSKLRVLLPYPPKTLDRLARKFLTPTKLSVVRAPRWWEATNKEPIYPAWTRGTRQSPCLPFESGDNTLPGMEAHATTGAKA